MNPLLLVSGVMIILGTIYWWQQQVTAFAGDSAIRYSFTCLISGGLHSCPILNTSLNNDNLVASVLFYGGVLMLLYTFFFPKPPLPPASAL